MRGRRMRVAIAPYDEDDLFRWVVVSRVRAREARSEPRSEAVACVAKEVHRDARGTARRVSERSIYRWLAAEFARPAAAPPPCVERAPSLVLPADLLEFLAREKRGDLEASIPELLRRADERGHLKPAGLKVDRTTVYRALVRMGVPMARRKSARMRDSRRFAYAHRMEMVLCDGKHFNAGVTRAKRVALFFLDDATRFCLHVVVGTSESTALFLRGVFELVTRWGLPGGIYLDNGPGFISDDTVAVLKALGPNFIHGEAAYAEGHGKIEALNKTAKRDVLRGYDRQPGLSPDCGHLELRLDHYRDTQYNPRPHESLDGDTPSDRFHRDEAPLRFPQDEATLRKKFVIHEQRTVSNDHVVNVDSIHYETPRGTAGTVVMVQRNLLDGAICLLHAGRYIQLHPADLVANARARRAKPHQKDEVQHPLPKSAADLAFERDFRPAVDADGNYPRRRGK